MPTRKESPLDLPPFKPHTPGQSGGPGGPGGSVEKHKYLIERLPEQDMVLVSRDGGEPRSIPMRLLAQGRTIAEIYEELSDGN